MGMDSSWFDGSETPGPDGWDWAMIAFFGFLLLYMVEESFF